jgi:hypothetical protein
MADILGLIIGIVLMSVLVLPIPIAIWAVFKR